MAGQAAPAPGVHWAAAAGRGERPSADLQKFFSSGLVTDLPSDQSRYVQVLYDRAEAVHQVHQSIVRAQKMGDYGRVHELMDEFPGAKALDKQLTEAKSSMSKLTQLINQAEASKTMGAEAKKHLLDQLRQRRNDVANRAEARLPAY